MNALRNILYTLNTEYRASLVLAQLRRHLKTGREICLVHQMGRVGSMTIVNSLKAACPELPIYHTHFLNPEYLQNRLRTEKRNWGIKNLHLRVSRILVRELNTALRNRSWKIITIVREPVARNVSTFFHSIKLFMPGFDKKYREGTITPEIMLNSFLAELDHDLPLKWFDVDVKSVFGINVYDHSFPTEKGYGIISQDNVTLLVIRLENLRQCYKDAFADLLGFEKVDLKIMHVAEKDDKRGIYKQFKENLRLPDWYLNDMYSSKYTKHFYNEAEIKGFWRQWSKHLPK